MFNRTHYENVLVTRVHPSYILGENIPGINSVDDITEEFWENRFEQINNFEKQISNNGTIIFKFFLHLGKEEQRQRLLRRLNKAKHAPWYIIPSDNKEAARVIVAQIIYDEMKKIKDIDEPKLDEDIQKDIEMYKEILSKEKS